MTLRERYEREEPRCPSCGYTVRDCRELMDHRFCGAPSPAAACPLCDDVGCDVCRRRYGEVRP